MVRVNINFRWVIWVAKGALAPPPIFAKTIREVCLFLTNAQSRFAVAVLKNVLGAPQAILDGALFSL